MRPFLNKAKSLQVRQFCSLVTMQINRIYISNPYQTQPIPNLPNQTYQTKTNLPNQDKPTKPNQTQPTKHTEPSLPNQNYWLNQSTPGSVVTLAMFCQCFTTLITVYDVSIGHCKSILDLNNRRNVCNLNKGHFDNCTHISSSCNKSEAILLNKQSCTQLLLLHKLRQHILISGMKQRNSSIKISGWRKIVGLNIVG